MLEKHGIFNPVLEGKPGFCQDSFLGECRFAAARARGLFGIFCFCPCSDRHILYTWPMLLLGKVEIVKSHIVAWLFIGVYSVLEDLFYDDTL